MMIQEMGRQFGVNRFQVNGGEKDEIKLDLFKIQK